MLLAPPTGAGERRHLRIGKLIPRGVFYQAHKWAGTPLLCQYLIDPCPDSRTHSLGRAVTLAQKDRTAAVQLAVQHLLLLGQRQLHVGRRQNRYDTVQIAAHPYVYLFHDVQKIIAVKYARLDDHSIPLSAGAELT